MNKELVIEHFLTQLDRELQALPTGQRAEIITEIRSHILEALDKDSGRSVQSVLDNLGSPKAVALRYLEQKGVRYWAPSPHRNWVKWAVLGGLGLVATVVIVPLIGLALAAWHFSPLIQVDEEKGRVKILGGLIDVNEDNVMGLKIGDHTGRIQGEVDAAKEGIHSLEIPFNTAKLELRPSDDGLIHWFCKVRQYLNADSPITTEAGVLKLNLDKLNLAKCEVEIPSKVKTKVSGINGAISLERPLGDMAIKVTNGKVSIEPDQQMRYNYDIKVQNGAFDHFTTSSEPQANIEVDMVNGVVRKE
ncbi:MAG: DUF1700 domain-containing protein [Bdellovibrionales bacterium]